jgi:hypothetical protein
MRKDFDQTWRALSDEVLTGMKAWRLHADAVRERR